jgi:hypothetical protein
VLLRLAVAEREHFGATFIWEWPEGG